MRFIHSLDGHGEPTIFAQLGRNLEPVIRRVDLDTNVRHLWPVLVDLIVKDEADR